MTYKCPISCAIDNPMLGPVSSTTAHRRCSSHAPLGLARPVVFESPRGYSMSSLN